MQTTPFTNQYDLDIKRSVDLICGSLGVTFSDLSSSLKRHQGSLSRSLSGNPTVKLLRTVAWSLGVPMYVLVFPTEMVAHGLKTSIKLNYEAYVVKHANELRRLRGQQKVEEADRLRRQRENTAKEVYNQRAEQHGAQTIPPAAPYYAQSAPVPPQGEPVVNWDEELKASEARLRKLMAEQAKPHSMDAVAANPQTAEPNLAVTRKGTDTANPVAEDDAHINQGAVADRSLDTANQGARGLDELLVEMGDAGQESDLPEGYRWTEAGNAYGWTVEQWQQHDARWTVELLVQQGFVEKV